MLLPMYMLSKNANADVGAGMCRAVLLRGTSKLGRNVGLL